MGIVHNVCPNMQEISGYGRGIKRQAQTSLETDDQARVIFKSNCLESILTHMLCKYKK